MVLPQTSPDYTPTMLSFKFFKLLFYSVFPFFVFFTEQQLCVPSSTLSTTRITKSIRKERETKIEEGLTGVCTGNIFPSQSLSEREDAMRQSHTGVLNTSVQSISEKLFVPQFGLFNCEQINEQILKQPLAYLTNLVNTEITF